MYKKMANKFRSFIPKTLGVVLGLSCSLSLVQAQQIQSAVNNNQRSSAPIDNQKQNEIEKRKQEAEADAEKRLIPEAIAVIEATKKTIEFAINGQKDQALASIQQATDKINKLLTDHPKDSLLPVDFSIDVVDTAPLEIDHIKKIGQEALTAIKDLNYPRGRLLLDSLQSEIHLSFYTLPLGAYPDALKEAHRLLDQNQLKDAAKLLETALTTLLVVDQIIPIPIIHTAILLNVAEEKLHQTQDPSQDNKNIVLKLIELSKAELLRAKDLGYASQDSEYNNLNDELKNLEGKIKNNENTSSTFATLKERIKAFLDRLYKEKHSAQNTPASKTAV